MVVKQMKESSVYNKERIISKLMNIFLVLWHNASLVKASFLKLRCLDRATAEQTEFCLQLYLTVFNTS